MGSTTTITTSECSRRGGPASLCLGRSRGDSVRDRWNRTEQIVCLLQLSRRLQCTVFICVFVCVCECPRPCPPVLVDYSLNPELAAARASANRDHPVSRGRPQRGRVLARGVPQTKRSQVLQHEVADQIQNLMFKLCLDSPFTISVCVQLDDGAEAASPE